MLFEKGHLFFFMRLWRSQWTYWSMWVCSCGLLFLECQDSQSLALNLST